jgi:hypothetical protein
MKDLVSAGLWRLSQASWCLESREWKENAGGEVTQFGIIRKSALYAGFGPGTVDLFRRLWGPETLPKIQPHGQIGQQSSLFDMS